MADVNDVIEADADEDDDADRHVHGKFPADEVADAQQVQNDCADGYGRVQGDQPVAGRHDEDGQATGDAEAQAQDSLLI